MAGHLTKQNCSIMEDITNVGTRPINRYLAWSRHKTDIRTEEGIIEGM
jgi:hypothetical protein